MAFLRKNVDVFAWSDYEAPMVDPNFICHYLNVNPSDTPKKEPRRCSSKEHSKAVKEEVVKFKHAGVIKEVFLPRMVGQHCSGEEEEREVMSVCRFHRFK